MVSVGLETGSFEVGSNILQVTVQWTVGPTSNAEVTLDHPMRAVYFPTIVNHCGFRLDGSGYTFDGTY